MFTACTLNEPKVKINRFEVFQDPNNDDITSPGEKLTVRYEIEVTNFTESYSSSTSSSVECLVTITGDTNPLEATETNASILFYGNETRQHTFKITVPASAQKNELFRLNLSAVLAIGNQADQELVITTRYPKPEIRVTKHYISGGDKDGRLVPGEKDVRLQLQFSNLGRSPSGRINSYVSTNDAYATITNGSTIDMYNINPGDGTGWYSVTFQYGFSAPMDHPCFFYITSQDPFNQTWVDTIKIVTGVGPKVEISNWTLSDPTGNNNGIANPGEAINIGLTVKNSGTGRLEKSSITVSTSDSDIRWNSYRVAEVPELQIGEQFDTEGGNISLLVLASHPETPIPLILTITDNHGNEWKSDIAVPVIK